MRRIITTLALLATLLGVSAGAHAALITTTLGNGASGFNDGDILTAPQVGTAQGGQPTPFDQPFGSDILANLGNFSASWTFNYAAILDPILNASLTIGIYDHDSAASGNQLASYGIDGNDLTTPLDILFEGGGGDDTQYNVYTIALGAGLFADLADGIATASLDLQGAGLIFELGLFGCNCIVETGFNGANLIFSSLVIETLDQGQVPVPEPATWSLLAVGLGAMLWCRRRKVSPKSIPTVV